MTVAKNIVSVNFLESAQYPQKAPFDPPMKYPEYIGEAIDPENMIYPAVREMLFKLGLDKDNFDTHRWNPLGGMIKPGMTVFLKPNTVRHQHQKKKNIFSIIVHGSLLRPILDYVCIALENRGRIIVGDSQTIFSDFDRAISVSRIKDLLDHYRNWTSIPIECFDLRQSCGVRTWLYGKWGRREVNQDPRGYRFVNLGSDSCLEGVDPDRLRISISDPGNMIKHHSNGKHEYLFPKSFLDSDVIISIPKMKTHRRTGVTLALKNVMGLPSWKDTLPHYTTGSRDEGGDQYIHSSKRKRICTMLHDGIHISNSVPKKFALAVMKKILWNTGKIVPFKDSIYEAMWYGNDTLWRTILDLNRIVLYADKEGILRDTTQRSFFGLVDGIIAGEGDGPVAVDPVNPGVLLAGTNPVFLDAVTSTLMGFNYQRIPMISQALVTNNSRYPLADGFIDNLVIARGNTKIRFNEFKSEHNLHFKPHPNWQGHIEL